MSLPPISDPAGSYLSGQLNLQAVPIWDGLDPIEEPRLRVNNIPWLNRAGSPNVAGTAEDTGGLLGHARLGSKITIFVLCYGSDHGLHKRCLSSIMRTVPRDKVDLRIALNCASPETADYARELEPDKVYSYSSNKLKYPIMRDMFWDKTSPITTPYLVWFDDDCYVSHGNWLNLLASTIIRQPPFVGMYGIPARYGMELGVTDPRDWFRAAPWFRNRHFANAKGIDAPNGDSIFYCPGWFWAMRTDIIQQCNVPCPRLLQAGGDIAIGEQLHQAGIVSKQFNVGKALVYTEAHGKKRARGPQGLRYPWVA